MSNLFQKRVMRTKFDICVFITITTSIPSPRGYHQPNSHCFRTDTDMLYYRNLYIGNLCRFWLSCLSALVYLLLIRFLIIVLSSVSDEGYSRNVSCALNMICTFFSCTYWNIMLFFLKIVMKSDLQSVVFLEELTEILVGKVAKKRKCILTIYALLRLITKGVIHRLCKGKLLCVNYVIVVLY